MGRLLIVVDYQRDFVDGALGFPGAACLDGPIADRIRDYWGSGDDVVFTYDTHTPAYGETMEGKKLPVPHCIQGSRGWELYGAVGELALQGGASRCFLKPTFPSLELAVWLAGRDYARVELCGLVSHICVLSNAVMVKAALPDAEIVVDARLTASYDPVLHEKALDILEGLHVEVTNR